MEESRAAGLDDLADEILLDIFYRLPINTIGLCMCVNKSWLSLIKTPSFVCSYTAMNSKKREKDQYFIYRKDFQELLFYRNNKNFDFDEFVTLPTQVLSAGWDICVCNGVICFAKNRSTIMLWNPTIRKTLTLPEPPRIGQGQPVLGFAFESLTSDYKVVRILDSQLYQLPSFEIFSLNSNSWKTDFPRYHIPSIASILLNGVLHWICGWNGCAIILAFDVSTEIFREIQPPAIDEHRLQLQVYKEFFLACINYSMYIWVMKEYGNVESWCQIWKFDNHVRRAYTDMMGFRFNNGEMLFCKYVNDWKDMIVSINPDSQEENELDVLEGRKRICNKAYDKRFIYFEKSLVLLENKDDNSSKMDFEQQENTGGNSSELDFEKRLVSVENNGDDSSESDMGISSLFNDVLVE